VIFSVVDGTLPLCNPYFTDTRIEKGRMVLNTTLSRVKSKLILVLEKGFWTSKAEQFLGDLARLAEPW
jgi:hypothetical protein